MHPIEFEVDTEQLTTDQKVLTPVQIMTMAGVDPATHYLVQLKGQHQESYQGKPQEQIHMHPKMKFITVSTGPTPVSYLHS